MAASSTWTQPSLSNVSCVNARCTGFAKVRGKNDFAFVVETEWSDCRKQCVKRTFDEFQLLHSCLTKAFPDAKGAADKKMLSLRSGIKDLFTQDRRRLAELREPVVDAYLRDLTSLPEKVSQSSLVLTFLEPRDTDPKPVRAQGDSSTPNADCLKAAEDGTGDGQGGRQPATNPSWKAYRDWCVATVLKSLHHNSDSDGGHTVNVASRPQPTPSQDYDDEADEEASTISADDGIDENYFLNVGVQELMLLDADMLASAATGQLDSMWCSDLEKFSEVLRDNISAFPLAPASRRHQHLSASVDDALRVAKASDMTESAYQQCAAGEVKPDDDVGCTAPADDECSDTESQRMERSYCRWVDSDAADSDDLQSDDEFAEPRRSSAVQLPHTNAGCQGFAGGVPTGNGSRAANV